MHGLPIFLFPALLLTHVAPSSKRSGNISNQYVNAQHQSISPLAQHLQERPRSRNRTPLRRRGSCSRFPSSEAARVARCALILLAGMWKIRAMLRAEIRTAQDVSGAAPALDFLRRAPRESAL